MKEIPLTKGKYAIVDDEDYEKLSTFKWQSDSNNYACRQHYHKIAARRYCYKKVYMHTDIMGKKDGFVIDHINGNGSDNRKVNLRHVTNSQNHYNSKAKRFNSSSDYKGVDWHAEGKKWRSRIVFNRKSYHLGLYDDEKDAAWVYNVWAESMFGEYARLNVLED